MDPYRTDHRREASHHIIAVDKIKDNAGVLHSCIIPGVETSSTTLVLNRALDCGKSRERVLAGAGGALGSLSSFEFNAFKKTFFIHLIRKTHSIL